MLYRLNIASLFHLLRRVLVTLVTRLKSDMLIPKLIRTLLVISKRKIRGFPGDSVVKNLPEMQETTCNAGNSGLILGSGRSLGNGMATHSQYSCLENSMDGRTWLATVHVVTKSLHIRHKGIILVEVRLSSVKMSMMLLFFCHQVMSDFSQPHGLKHTRLLCPSLSPKVCPSSYLLNW